MGLLLKKRYKKIVLVKPNKINSHYGKRDAYLTLSSDTFKKPLQRELAYIESSPNYCDRDAQKRIPGTMERVCNRTSTEEDSCKLLCCGRGYNTHEIVRRYRCNCKFHWCCYVKCNKCKERMEVFKCKWGLLRKRKEKTTSKLIIYCQCSRAKTWVAAINRLQPLSKFDGLQLITDGQSNWIRMNQQLMRYMEVMRGNICNALLLEQW